jgi:CheY-like chemotaxis protein
MPIRILVAEDSPSVRTALRSLLEGAGPWEIVAVENGKQAIAKAQELRPNLIILDLVMPVMDGLKAARQISERFPDIPILMHTMHWSPQVEIEAQKVGVRKVVPKTDNRLLISTVRQFLVSEPSPSPSNVTLIAASQPPSPDPAIPIAAPSPQAFSCSEPASAEATGDRPEASASGPIEDAPAKSA